MRTQAMLLNCIALAVFALIITVGSGICYTLHKKFERYDGFNGVFSMRYRTDRIEKKESDTIDNSLGKNRG